MKHKAQESYYSLEKVDCRYIRDTEEVQDCLSNKCKGCILDEALKTLQDLINCQLTPTEATAIFTAAGNFATVFNTLKDTGIFNEKSIEVIKSIAKDLNSGLNKLQKQKEMWVSEDE